MPCWIDDNIFFIQPLHDISKVFELSWGKIEIRIPEGLIAIEEKLKDDFLIFWEVVDISEELSGIFELQIVFIDEFIDEFFILIIFSIHDVLKAGNIGFVRLLFVHKSILDLLI